MNYSCLIIDDEETIAQTTSEYFNMFDIPSYYVTSYEDALAFLSVHQASLILLDINLGGRSGFELCKQIRETMEIPILFISARTDDDDVLTALNIGGDDYIKKPFRLNILLAKIKAALRRCSNAPVTLPDAKTWENKSVALDYNYHQAIVDGASIPLKEMEFKLLGFLMENTGKVITKKEIFDHVWADCFVGEGTLSVHIRRLRCKIEKNPDNPLHIKTIWGVGYLFENADAANLLL